MNSQWTLYVTLAGFAFAAALLSVIRQWLGADQNAATVEAGLQQGREVPEQRGMAMSALSGAAEGEFAPPQTDTRSQARVESKPMLIADDEEAVARLCLGWGGGGMLVGMLSGAATHGFVGALIGAVTLSAAMVGVAVVIALVLDRQTLKAWNEKHPAA
ncbi:MAG: hypothetical protein WCJ30_09625 [Deltaproteobacteria bacterium]